jgi:rRNA-processing protein FCF1
MDVLLDTNIIIDREDSEVLPKNLKILMKNLSDLQIQKIIHPLSIQEIKKDSNLERRKVNESKVLTYSILKNPPLFSKDLDFCSKISSKTHNDQIDNAILYSVYKNAADFLITQDKGIHRKAFKIGISDRVLSIDDALSVFKVKELPIMPPSIYEDKFYNLDINDEIFNDLKEDYAEFIDWFNNHPRRNCLVYQKPNGKLGALLVYKDEDENIDLQGVSLPKKKRLKIATLVVSSTGNKIGEFFIQWAARYAIKKGFTEIYLTHFIKHDDYLVYLIEKYGFFNVGKNNYQNSKGEFEEVFIKYLNPTPEQLDKLNYPPEKISQIFYPKFYDGTNVNKFVVPIKPEFHEKLFLDNERQSRLYEQQGFIVEGNAIKKAYLTRAPSNEINPGDILLFYRTQDTKSITCIGVVEKDFHNFDNPNEIIKVVGKRTVYSPKDIGDLTDESRVMILLFTFSAWIPNKIKLKKLVELDILKAHPQRIHKISHEAYLKLKKEGGIDEGFTIN